MQEANQNQVEAMLTDVLASGYRPNIPASSFWGTDGLPSNYLYRDIETMLTHPRVKFSLGCYKSGIADLQVEIEASSSEVGQFVEGEWNEWWANERTTVQLGYDWGWQGCESVYKVDKGLLRFDYFEPFTFRDVNVLTRGRKYVGLRVNPLNLDLFGPEGDLVEETDGEQVYVPPAKLPAKAFWYAHRPRYGYHYGESQLMGAWRPYRRLAGQDGAEFVVDASVYRFGVAGPVIKYPIDDKRDASGNMNSSKNRARELAENAKAGVSIVMPSTQYPQEMGGGDQWSVEFPDHTINVSGLLEYIKRLEDAICYGIGVPTEVLEASETGSGYSGRAVPLEMYLMAQQELAHAIVQGWKWQIGDGLVAWNFGPESWFRIKAKSLLKTKMQATQPGMAQPQQGETEPQVAQFSTARFGWVHDPTTRTKNRWKNTDTGNVRYQKTKPADKDGEKAAAKKIANAPTADKLKTAHRMIEDVRSGKSVPPVQMRQHLMGLTVSQLRQLKAKFGLKTSPRLKAQLVEALRKHLVSKRKPVDGATIKAEATKQFGKLKPEHATEMLGLPVGASAKVGKLSKENDGSYGVWVTASHPGLAECKRFIGIDKDGNRFIRNESLILRDDLKGSGLGSTIFSTQINQARNQGFAYIKTHAAGNGLWAAEFKDQSKNGYYTWPRLGYDQSINSIGENDSVFADQLRRHFPKAQSILDIVTDPNVSPTGLTPEDIQTVKDRLHKIDANRGKPLRDLSRINGRDYWQAMGRDLSDMRFDLKPGSRSLDVLNAYNSQRGKNG